jgi:thiol:disulfide interchange protein
MAKVPKGELTGAEIRKLIRGHNKLTNIKVPTGLDRDGLIKFLKSKKFEVDHKNKRLIDKSPARGKSVSLETAKAITKPKPKTALQKQKAEEAKAEKAEKKKKEERMIRKKAVEEEKKRAKPKPKTASIAVGTEEKKTSKPKRKSDAEILKENGYPTLSEYKAEIKKLRGDKTLAELPLKQRKVIVKYVEEIAKKLGVDANIKASPKDFFDRQVGNLERQFGFLAQKLREKK